MSRRKRKLGLVPSRKALIALAVVALAAGAWFGYPLLDQCGEGVEHRGPWRECVGVTDGSFHFAPELAKVEEKILEQNRKLEGHEHETVTIAVMRAMTHLEKDQLEPLIHGLEGAYIAQLDANTKAEKGGKKPFIRLLVANNGGRSEQWAPVVSQLQGLVDSQHHLVAVVALGPSLATTRQAVMELTRGRDGAASNRVAVVGATFTADNLTNIPGLVRVAPTNSDETAAAVRFADVLQASEPDSPPSASSPLLIRDTRKGDLYVKNLGDVFIGQVPALAAHPEEFNSSPGSMPANTFSRMKNQICQANPSMIYFAGRAPELAQLVTELGERGCSKQTFTVLTGDDAAHLDTSDPALREALASGIRVYYTALAHPDTWAKMDPNTITRSASAYTHFREAFAKAGFPEADLLDGGAIMAHDATLTAITGIQNLADEQDPLPAPTLLIEEWKRIHGIDAIDGASGKISLANNGNPENKAIPILQATPDGTIKFTQLSWPDPVSGLVSLAP